MRPSLSLLERTQPGGVHVVLPKLEELRADDSGEVLVCKACRYPITTTAARIEAFGAHLHDRINLAGQIFRIGLFSDAPGAKSVTPPSPEFPWFPGYVWQIVVCTGCVEHLGWFFSGPSRFFGLLPDKLVAAPSDQGHDPSMQ